MFRAIGSRTGLELGNSPSSASEEQSKVLVHLTPCSPITYGQLAFACTTTGPTLNCFPAPLRSINQNTGSVCLRPAGGELPAMKKLTPGRPFTAPRSSRGFSVLELVTVVAVGLILAAIAAPLIQSTTRVMRLNAAVSAVTGTMQSTRYRAIYDGCPYQVSFFKDSDTYQIASEATGGACAAAFTNVGTAVPFSRTSYVTLDQNVTFQFSPGGSVTVTTGASTFNLSYVGYATTTKQVQVTKYGSITVH